MQCDTMMIERWTNINVTQKPDHHIWDLLDFQKKKTKKKDIWIIK